MPSPKRKILIVDDLSSMRKMTRNILRALGHKNVLEAANGEAALKVLKREPVDLVLTDWNMPVMNGLDFLKAIRADEKLKKLPVLMMTAEVTEQNVIDAVKAGITSYIIKPFTPAVLARKVNAILKD